MDDAPLIVLKELAGNPVPELDELQAFFAPYSEHLTTFWISVWVMTAIILIVMYLDAYKTHRSDKGR